MIGGKRKFEEFDAHFFEDGDFGICGYRRKEAGKNHTHQTNENWKQNKPSKATTNSNKKVFIKNQFFEEKKSL